jgi:uncharacterized protein (TIGR03790 family)
MDATASGSRRRATLHIQIGRANAGVLRRLHGWTLLIIVVLGACPRTGVAQFLDNTNPWPRFLLAAQLAIVVNIDSPASVELGNYYQRARKIPSRNVVRVRIPGSPRGLSAPAFAELKQQIDAQLDSSIQAIVLIWTAPYAVECNSITSALTLGFQADLCAPTCKPSRVNPYFDSDSLLPFKDYGLRLTMLLPTESVELGKALIDRGVQSDGTSPRGSAYFLKTSDTMRSSRARFFPPSGHLAHPSLELVTLSADSIENRQDVMFYFTGAAHVPKLETLKFLPGAVADHLTSTGGDLLGGAQMSSLRWLEAGATASYGTVSEPCNYWQKFPNPEVFLNHYLSGESVIAAYWKSVMWPAQGLFIGEPLAAPYRQ